MEFNFDGNMEQDYTEGIDTAFDNTFRLITGRAKIENMVIDNEIYLLYDPYDIDELDFKNMLLDMIEHYIESEEYEKCQEIQDIINSSEYKELIKKITLDIKDTNISRKDPAEDLKGLSSVDQLISLFKEYAEAKKPKKEKTKNLAADELWECLTESDKNIFEGKYIYFKTWMDKLEPENIEYYSNRIMNDLPLIPVLGEEKYNHEEEYNYNNLILTIIGEYICISNYSYEKIKRLQKMLIVLGVKDSDIRVKQEDGETVYTLIYSSKNNF